MIAVTPDPVGLIGTVMPSVVFASLQSNLAPARIDGLKLLPLPDAIAVTLDRVVFISAVLVALATPQGNQATTSIHDSELLPLSKMIAVTLDPVGLIGTVMPMPGFATFQCNDAA